MFIKQLAEEDLHLKLSQPRAWTDAAAALQTKRKELIPAN